MVERYFDPLGLPKDALIVDVGCGHGAFLRQMDARGYHALGITMSDADVEGCKPFEAVIADMADLPVFDGVVDLVWCRHTLEHSPYPLFALYEFERVLKPGGKIFIEVPAPDCARPHEFNPNHYSIMGTRMWQALIEKAKLTLVNMGAFDCEVQRKDEPDNKWTERSFIIQCEKPHAIEK